MWTPAENNRDAEVFDWLKRCDYVVQATHEERTNLYCRFALDDFFEFRVKDKVVNCLNWSPSHKGYMITIGWLSDGEKSWPVNICIDKAIINLRMVLFWEIVSDVCWYSKADRFLRDECKHLEGCSGKFVDATNFFNVVLDMRRQEK